MGTQFGHQELADRVEQLEAEVFELTKQLSSTQQQLDVANTQHSAHMNKDSQVCNS